MTELREHFPGISKKFEIIELPSILLQILAVSISHYDFAGIHQSFEYHIIEVSNNFPDECMSTQTHGTVWCRTRAERTAVNFSASQATGSK